jgi:translation initiation factor 2 subunit 2
MSNLYPLNFLIDRIYVAEKEATKTSKMPEIQVKYINRKTHILNFGALCKALGRDKEAVKTFFESELHVETSINSNDMLIMNGRYDDVNKIKLIFRSYTSIYVMCKECKSIDTVLEKVDKLLVIRCNNCLSAKTVTK